MTNLSKARVRLIEKKEKIQSDMIAAKQEQSSPRKR
jgi:hypothetical protein